MWSWLLALGLFISPITWPVQIQILDGLDTPIDASVSISSYRDSAPVRKTDGTGRVVFALPEGRYRWGVWIDTEFVQTGWTESPQREPLVLRFANKTGSFDDCISYPIIGLERH